MRRFERGLEDTERTALAAAKAAAALNSSAKALQKAAAEGDLGKLKRASEKLGAAFETARQETANARSAWPFSAEEEERYLAHEYQEELVELANSGGLRLEERDGVLICFPSVVRILPGDRAARIDKKRTAAIRPSHLVATLKANQEKKPKFAPEKFLEALAKAYKTIAGRDGVGVTVSLARIYETLTLLPGASVEYDQSDFGRDVYLLDVSGLTQTRSGERFTLPASSGTKGGKTFTFVGPSGKTEIYYGIKFYS